MKSSLLWSLLTFLALPFAPPCFSETPASSSGSSAEPIGERFPRNAKEFDQLFGPLTEFLFTTGSVLIHGGSGSPGDELAVFWHFGADRSARSARHRCGEASQA